MNACITLACGHTSALDDAFIRRDQYRCPVCRQSWHWVTGPPVKHPSGWIEPGTRTMHPGLPDLGLPHADDLRARRRLAQEKQPSLARVLQQAAASERHRNQSSLFPA